MSKQEIIENNKLIAEFMGAKMIVENYHGINIIEFPDKSTKSLFGLEYHSSWDWIIPIVEKIEKEFTVKIIRYADELSNVCEIETTEDNPLQITYCCGYDYDGKTKIQVVFDAVVEFIKWYNQNK